MGKILGSEVCKDLYCLRCQPCHSYTPVSGPPPACFFGDFSILSSLHTACAKGCADILMIEDQRSLTCIGGRDADLAPARMVLCKIQDQKQKYNFEWPYSDKDRPFMQAESDKSHKVIK